MASPRSRALAGAALSLLVCAACSKDLNSPPAVTRQADHTIGEPPEVHTFWICKEGTDASFKVDTTSVNNQNVPIGTTGSFNVDVPEGTCVKVARSPDLPGGITTFMRVVATELPAANVQLDSIVVEHFGIPPAPPVAPQTITGTSTVTRVINGDIGYVTTWYNSSLTPHLTLAKTAAAGTVTAGDPIGFTLTTTSNGTGTANAVVLKDTLPGGTGINWSIGNQPAGNPCAIAGSPQVLTCNFGDLATGTTRTVDLTSLTTGQSCGTYNNTAYVSAGNFGPISASASVVVDCPITPCPAGTFTYSFINASGDLQIKYDQFPAPNDNSYGVNAVGWGTHAHRFSDLVGSDHAGFQLVDGNGTIKLQFNVDYISANASAPSGYASLGVTGGDGKMLIGTATGISATTSLDRNLNNINIPGLFNAGHVQQFGSVNLLVDSPPTDAAHSTYVISDPTLTGWDFHDTYYVTVSAAKLASIGFDPNTWRVEPSLTQLHNSPAKPCPPVAGVCGIAATKYEVKDKQVKVTLTNTASTDAILTELSLNWPTSNGKLMQVKLDGDIVYDKPDIAGGSALLTVAQLVADQNKRKVGKLSSDVLTLVFEKNADTDLSHYASTVKFGTCVIAILPK